jgi:lysophospholipase L1-like esterase
MSSPRRRLGLLAAGVALAAMPWAPAAHAAPSSPTTAVVTMGDSYISGEAGRWQGNSFDPAPGNDGTDRACAPAGPGCQVDKSRVYVGGSAANGCHRSDTAEVLSAVLPVGMRDNIACSGAVTKNIFRASSGGMGQNGEAAQADQLLAVAQAQDVKMIVVSIGGNDLGFSGIVAACLENYLAKQGPCEPKEQAAIQQALPKATADVEKAIDEIRAVMTQAGYGASDYRLVMQTYPSVIPRASEARYSQNDPQRSNACPFYDQDLTWGRDTASPEIGAMVKAAAAARGVEVLDLGNALQGHEFCSKSDQLVTPLVPPSPATSEWGRFLGGSTVQQGDLQEAFHPNAYAQRALGVCLTQLYRQAPGRFACADTAGKDFTAMSLTRTGAVAGAPPPGSPGPSAAGPCLSHRALTVHLRRGFRRRVVRAHVLVAGRPAGSFHRVSGGVRITLRGRPRGTVTVRIVMRLRGGRIAVDTRRYRLCAAAR